MESNLDMDSCPTGTDDLVIRHGSIDGRHFGKQLGDVDSKFDCDTRCESGYKSVDEAFFSGDSACSSERIYISGEPRLPSVTELSEKGSTIDSIDEGIGSINLSTGILHERDCLTEPRDTPRLQWDRETACQNAYQQDEDGDTHLHTSIIQYIESLSLHVIKLAIDPEFLSIRNYLLQTPLHLAVITKQPLLVRKLITAGADVDIRDHCGNTPLHIACKEGESLIVSLILQPVTEEETKSNPYKIQQRNTPQNLEARNYEGQVCLHLAAERANCKIIHELIIRGANLNAKDGKSGRTILHYAAESGDGELVRFLLSLDSIEVDSETYGGLTPLKLAKGRCHTDIVKMLKDKGAYCYDDSSSEDDMEAESNSDDYAIGGNPVMYRN